MESTRISSLILIGLILISITFPTVKIGGFHNEIPIVTLAQTNQTTTPQTTNQPQNTTEWWEIGANLVKFGEEVVGVCYPWLVTKHFIINLPTGTTYPGTGGDTSEEVSCGDNVFIVKGKNGIYVFRKDTGTMINTVHLTASKYIGAKDGTVGVYSYVNNIVYIKFIEGSSDVGVKLSEVPYMISYTMLSSIPVVGYSAVPKNSTTTTYYLSNLGKTVKLPYMGSGAIYLSGNEVYLESNNGLLALKITDPVSLTYKEDFFIPLPFKITEIKGEIKGYLLVSSYGILIKINVDKNSLYFKTWKVIGDAEPTSVGYYTPSTKTTYVITDNGIYPVPGKATGILENVVFTNVPIGNSSIGIMWPLRSAIVVFVEPFNGELYMSDYSIKLDIQGGTYRLPMGGVLKYGQYTLLLDQPEQYFPPEKYTEQQVIPASSVNYSVIQFPSLYVPYDTFQNVKYVGTGGGRVILIQNDKAIVYSEYGPTISIPGTWMFGGVGECVVLYDGASFRVFDYAGNPLATYSYYMSSEPDYVSCAMKSGQPVVLLFKSSKVIYIGSNGTKIENKLDVGEIRDPTGVSVLYTIPYQVRYSGFVYPLPLKAMEIHINKYWATWKLNGNGYILSVPDSVVYVLMNLPSSKTLYPIDDKQVALYDKGTQKVEIIPYKSWFTSNCYLNVNTDPQATVYINGRQVGVGPVKVYTKCGASLNVKVTEQYHHPASKYVTVSGPTTLELRPKPMISRVTLVVQAPDNLTIDAVEVNVDGNNMLWHVGEPKTFIPKEHKISILKFYPVDVCEHTTFNTTFKEGTDTLEIQCNLVSSVLALHSNVTTIVKIYTKELGVKGKPISTVYVQPDKTEYVKIPQGDYLVQSNPVNENYTTKIINVTVPVKKILYLDVTPYSLSRLVAKTNVPTATITVSYKNGTKIRSSVGKIDVKLLPGTYMVSAIAPNYSQYVNMVQIKPGQSVTLNITLTPLAPQKPPQKPPIWKNTKFQISTIIVVVIATILALWWKKRRLGAIENIEVEGGEPV